MREHRCLGWTAAALILSFLTGGSVLAQDHTGTVSGAVVDEQGDAIPGAMVSLINEATSYARSLASDARGEFHFLGVQPGTYTVKIELAGFNTLVRKNTVLPTSGSISLGRLKLGVGAVSETVTVVASGTPVEVGSSEHSGLITATQLEQISTLGRDLTSLLRLLPGVSYRDDVDSLGGEGFASELPNIGGQRQHFNHVTVDGVFGNEIGGANRYSALVNLDAVEEVKVLGAAYRAELGRGSAQIQITGKKGGSKYKGSAGYFKRHEGLNANDFFRNRAGQPKPRYRFDTYTVSLGGPVAVPWLMDEKKQRKLFFFYSGQKDETTNPRNIVEFRVPSLLERRGDFSQTRNTQGNLIVVRNPYTGQPFPGNVVPPELVNASGQSLLNLFPPPNFSEPGNPHNYRVSPSTEIPKMNHSLRLDYKASGHDTFYLTLRSHRADQIGFQTSAGPAERGRWGLYRNHYDATDRSATLGHTHIFGAHLLNEALVSYRRQTELTYADSEADMERLLRAAVGFTLGQLNPSVNPLGLIPNANFRNGNIPVRSADNNTPEINLNSRFPLDGHNFAVNFRDTLTWTKGTHLFKGGLYVEALDDNEGEGANVGTFDFRHDATNPFSTGYGYANALLGTFHTYTEASTRRPNQARGWVLEWFAQDTWRTTRRLTLDYGVRFLWVPTPWMKSTPDVAAFVPERWDPAKAPLLYVPTLVNGARMGKDPRTGQTVNALLIGTIIPGTGDPYNGMVLGDDPSYPRGFRDRQPPLPEPRLGFAYDLFGNGKSVLRGGAGIYHQPQLGVGIATDLPGNPPFGRTTTTYFGTFQSLLDPAAKLSLAPVSVRGYERNLKTPSVYTFSLGVEQAVGFGTVVGVTYVGSLGRHLNQTMNLNLIPDGARFLPQNVGEDGRVLPDNFLRPYRGYTDINFRSNFGTSNYNALQVAVSRRYTKGLQFSLAYTYSRALGVSDEDGENFTPNRPVESWHYAPHQRSQTHNLAVSYTYDLPRASRAWNTGLVRALFDGWQLSGEHALVSGNWFPVRLDRQSVDYTGGSYTGDDGLNNLRPVMTGNPNLTRERRRQARPSGGGQPGIPWFDVTVFQRPAIGAYGNTPRRVVRGPGVDNWNLSFFKNVGLGGSHKLQVRWEIFNVLNHTQFDDLNVEARFDAQGNQTNADFGMLTSARRPRVMQASLRLSF